MHISNTIPMIVVAGEDAKNTSNDAEKIVLPSEGRHRGEKNFREDVFNFILIQPDFH